MLQNCVTKPPISGGFVTENDVTFATRSLSTRKVGSCLPSASAAVGKRRERKSSNCSEQVPKRQTMLSNRCAARAGSNGRPGGAYLLMPAEHGPDVLRDSNLIALARRIATRYYIGFGRAVVHYG